MGAQLRGWLRAVRQGSSDASPLFCEGADTEARRSLFSMCAGAATSGVLARRAAWHHAASIIFSKRSVSHVCAWKILRPPFALLASLDGVRKAKIFFCSRGADKSLCGRCTHMQK